VTKKHGYGEGVTRLPPLDPAVAATRLAARAVLSGLAAGPARAAEAASQVRSSRSNDEDHDTNTNTNTARDTGPAAPPLVLVALSGGADSLALAAALAFEAVRAGVRAGAVVVDHGLQVNSAEVAARAAEQARGLGLDPVVVRRVRVDEGATLDGEPSPGPEAAARAARYSALDAVRRETGAETIVTAHTRDDQAEQVLLALARGSGTRAIAGIPPARGVIRRPFLSVDRATTLAACRAQGLEPWVDPHNSDPSFTRVRVRERALPLLERELGPGVAANLARSAELAREDADALDAMAAALLREILDAQSQQECTLAAARCTFVGAEGAGVGGTVHEVAEAGSKGGEAAEAGEDLTASLPVTVLAEAPPALRQRVIRLLAREQFGSHLSREHTLAIAALVTEWRGQGPIDVPGLTVTRTGARGDARLVFRSR